MKDDDRDVVVIFSPRLEKELWRHAGRWVAIEDDEIVAAGETVAEVTAGETVAEVTAGGTASRSWPKLYKVPIPGETRFYGVVAGTAS